MGQLRRRPGSDVRREAGGFVTDSALTLSLVSLC